MKRIAFLPFLLIFACCHNAADNSKTVANDSAGNLSLKKDFHNPYIDVDVSVMDMNYYPVDYPKLKMNHLTTAPPLARVIYSRPVKGGRKIFGGVVPYNKQWRLGANEATEIEFFETAYLENNKVKPGRYILYCIPTETNWKMVLNKDIFTWGKEIDSTQDILSFTIPVQPSDKRSEYFTMFFAGDKSDEAQLCITWDDIIAKIQVRFGPQPPRD